jgi:hypothetical protein
VFPARCWQNWSGLPIISATSAPSATMPSFALMHAHCGMLRERAARGRRHLGHRLMRYNIVPGGVARDIGDDGRSHPGHAG